MLFLLPPLGMNSLNKLSFVSRGTIDRERERKGVLFSLHFPGMNKEPFLSLSLSHLDRGRLITRRLLERERGL